MSPVALKGLKKMEKDIIKVRDSYYDESKLRRNIIRGLPCNFLQFKEVEIPNQLGSQVFESQYAFVAMPPTLKNPRKNLRREIWMILCKIEDIKH